MKKNVPWRMSRQRTSRLFVLSGREDFFAQRFYINRKNKIYWYKVDKVKISYRLLTL